MRQENNADDRAELGTATSCEVVAPDSSAPLCVPMEPERFFLAGAPESGKWFVKQQDYDALKVKFLEAVAWLKDRERKLIDLTKESIEARQRSDKYRTDAYRWQKGCKIGFPRLRLPEHTGDTLHYWTNGTGKKYASAELAIDALAHPKGEDHGNG